MAAAARRLGLARQTVQRVVDDLVRARQLELRGNLDHVRAPLVALTDAERDTLAAMICNSDQDRTALLERAHVAADEVRTARTMLTRLLVVCATRRPDTWRPPAGRTPWWRRRRSTGS